MYLTGVSIVKKTMGALFAALMISGNLWAQEPEIAKNADAAASEEGGVGLTAGLELGFGNVLDKAVVSLMPHIVFERSFSRLDVFGELDYTIFFDDPLGQELSAEVETGYNLPVSEVGTLSLLLNNQNTLFLAPEPEEDATHTGTLEPALLYTHSLAPGDFWAKAGLPFDYLTGVKDETALGAYLTAGWGSNFGLGLELTGNFALTPDVDFTGWGIVASYESGRFYGELGVNTGKEFTDWEILPEIDVTLGSIVFTVRAEIRIADGSSDWELTPFLGVGYQF
jgi:hypothetical protein